MREHYQAMKVVVTTSHDDKTGLPASDATVCPAHSKTGYGFTDPKYPPSIEELCKGKDQKNIRSCVKNVTYNVTAVFTPYGQARVAVF